jgi:phosphoribosylamine-glycine ligase
MDASTGSEVVVEEFLDGEEASFFALVDGPSAVALASAQDHKAAGDGDTGPNTGGMGAYSPAPVVTPDIEQQVRGEGMPGWEEVCRGPLCCSIPNGTFRLTTLQGNLS